MQPVVVDALRQMSQALGDAGAVRKENGLAAASVSIPRPTPKQEFLTLFHKLHSWMTTFTAYLSQAAVAWVFHISRRDPLMHDPAFAVPVEWMVTNAIVFCLPLVVTVGVFLTNDDNTQAMRQVRATAGMVALLLLAAVAMTVWLFGGAR